MDARPLRTHFKSFKGFRTSGTIACLFGGTVCSFGILDIITGVLMRVLFPSIYGSNQQFLTFCADFNLTFIILGVVISIISIQVFSAGIILLAFSTGSKIKDANRGVEYDELRKL